ncbi:hypothetical protein MAC_03095 [Metarhizium acridum CQMa 102]|uniref:Uncharacterized protein n=1 Tax=Metarhizium acridum (strain CQMa 102) TaxID=655827 RepID=E9DZP7_METAQ|nr:uncharacterized protein MAC_03095 [Metarhizium acridum CQMa 102]EFY90979.1 hypothetical protein MAC_03095 [Metarhizium acridum CQMa 102]
MPPLEAVGAARPRHLRQAAVAPKTPEPFAEIQAQPPSPARPKFRLRRRATSSQLNAPTQQFLASVAAADVPVPSIEGPQVYDDEDMLSIAYPSIPQLDRIDDVAFEHPSRRTTFSPPKTPAPEFPASPSTKQFPDWSIDAALSSRESSPEYDSSRPSTARSSETSSSLFSRFSLASEDLSQCASPESDDCDRFGSFLSPEDADRTIRSLMTATRSAKSRKAPWTRAMSQHLWSTYAMYLQDPKVTPFQVGKSGIPPPGVCMRVAREAKRSWKGSRPVVISGIKSGSSTPTGEAAGPYIEWPHTCAATRGHLRELCKARSGPSRSLQNLSNSPASFGKSINRFWNRRSAPAGSPSVFSGSDMAMSLAVCTSDSMQLQGPLAQLTASQPEPSTEATTLGHQPMSALGDTDTFDQPRPPLGSPFIARSYGPSSSTGLEEAFDFSPEAQRQARTVGTRRGLRSPLRLDQSRSSMQKRRSKQSVLEPQRTKRPSLGSDFWIDPASNENEASSAPLIQFSSTDSNHHDSLFVPRANLQELFEASHPGPAPAGPSSFPPTTGLTPSQTVPARLGSPFSAKATSHSFPNRHFSVSTINVDAVVRPFATVHQTGGESVNSTSSSSNKTPLANRLAYIDERLKGFRRGDREGRRSQSPF